MASIRPSTCSGTPEIIRSGAGPKPVRPVLPDQIMVAADPAGGDNHRRRVQLELAGLGTGTTGAAGGLTGREAPPAPPVDDPAGDGELVYAVPEPEAGQAGRRRVPYLPLERRHQPGSGAPGDVEPGHRVAVPVGEVAAPLGPAHQREPPHAHRVQPGPFLPGGEFNVGLRPLVRPVVLAGRIVDAAVEKSAAQPVLPGQLTRVLDSHPALCG